MLHGAELMPRLCHVGSHVNDTQKITLDLGASDHGAETCNLGASCYGAEPRVYILKDTYMYVFVNIFQDKG
jgi:hypothetical protein